ncbi:MAG: PEP-CTERM sorting domain-containing protein [Verrucomicrobia bacterium]|nr:MAG: PEP-CTERM sorting domain-containing protein [Verrucomicrobiota bacterium]
MKNKKLVKALFSAAILGFSVMETQAAIQMIDVSSYTPSGFEINVAGGGFILSAGPSFFGFQSIGRIQFGIVSPSTGVADIRNYSFGTLIDEVGDTYENQAASTSFRVDLGGTSGVAPDFGPGSYVGFKTFPEAGGVRYGWFEVTWNSTTNEFQVLSGAFEDSPGVGIAAGVIPEPSSALLLAGTALGILMRRRR